MKLTQYGIWHICTREVKSLGGRYLSYAVPRPFTEYELQTSTSIMSIPGDMRFEFGESEAASLERLHYDLKSLSFTWWVWLWLTKGRWS